METQTGIPIVINGEPDTVPENTTIYELLNQKGIDPSMQGIAVAVNEEVVRRKDWSTVALKPHDRVEIITATQGG